MKRLNFERETTSKFIKKLRQGKLVKFKGSFYNFKKFKDEVKTQYATICRIEKLKNNMFVAYVDVMCSMGFSHDEEYMFLKKDLKKFKRFDRKRSEKNMNIKIRMSESYN